MYQQMGMRLIDLKRKVKETNDEEFEHIGEQVG